MNNTLTDNKVINQKEMQAIRQELREIKQEMQALNKHLAAMTKMMQDYMLHVGAYIDRRNPDLTRFK